MSEQTRDVRTKEKGIAHTAGNVLESLTKQYPVLRFAHKFPWLRDFMLTIAEKGAFEESGFDQKFHILNLRGFEERIVGHLEEMGRIPEQFLDQPLWALMYVECNKFGEVNKAPLNEEVGDQFLRGYTDAFLSTIRRTDLACRHGGDEMMLLVRVNPFAEGVTTGTLKRIVEETRETRTGEEHLGILQDIAQKVWVLKRRLEKKHPALLQKLPEAGTMSFGVRYFTGRELQATLEEYQQRGTGNGTTDGVAYRYLKPEAEQMAQLAKQHRRMVAYIADPSSKEGYRVLELPEQQISSP